MLGLDKSIFRSNVNSSTWLDANAETGLEMSSLNVCWQAPLAYVAPELTGYTAAAPGSADITPAADIFSLGTCFPF